MSEKKPLAVNNTWDKTPSKKLWDKPPPSLNLFSLTFLQRQAKSPLTLHLSPRVEESSGDCPFLYKLDYVY